MPATPVELTYDSPSYDKYEDVKNKTIQERVLEWTEQLCESLAENYKQYHVRTLKGNLSGNYPEYAQKQLDELENGTANLMKFRIQEGRKYYKIIQQNFETYNNFNDYRDGSVHAFVDKNTGEVYMAASWNKPAKHVRFDMRIIKERTLMHTPSFVTWAGGYLYLR